MEKNKIYKNKLRGALLLVKLNIQEEILWLTTITIQKANTI